MGKLTGSSAIITGASSGVGRATTLLSAKEGAGLVITRRRRKLGRQVAEEVAKAVLFLTSDDSSFITSHILRMEGGRTAA